MDKSQETDPQVSILTPVTGPIRPDPLDALTDEALFDLHENGESRAFEILFKRYRQPLFRFVLRFLKDEADSEDAVQWVFLKILRVPSRFEARSRFSTWLHAIARNLCLDMLRKRKIRNHLSLDQPSGHSNGPPLAEAIPNGEPDVEQQAMDRSLRLKLLVAIRSLPREQRHVFLFRELAGMPFAEIANLTDSSVNTAKSRMRYALINLRRALRQLGAAPEAKQLTGPGGD